MMAFLKWLQKILAAFQHVRTGGKSTRTRARRIATRPPRRCHACGQEMKHSTDPRDYQDVAAQGCEHVPDREYR